MNKLWLVARHEYWRHVARRGFLFAVLGIPLIFALIIGGFVLFYTGKMDDPVGVVDLASLLLPTAEFAAMVEADHFVPFVASNGEAAAEQSLRRGDVQAYFVVPADYLETAAVRYVHLGDSFSGVTDDFRAYLRASLLAGGDPAVQRRFAVDPINLRFVSITDQSGRGDPATFILPFMLGFILVIGIFTTAGYLLQAVVDEKENRTMEILITSLSPGQLMTGKIAGLVAVGLTQISMWLLAVAIGYFIVRANVPSFPAVRVPLSTALIAAGWFLPFYLLIACLMAAIGLSVTSVSEGQQAVSIISLLCFVPYWFTFIFFENANSPLAVVLSIFPFTSPITILLRWQFSDIPTWQLAISWLLLAAAAALALFALGRLQRFGMLRYGQRLTLREVAAALRV